MQSRHFHAAWPIAATAALFATSPKISRAQATPAAGAIDGVVTDTSLVPLADATVWIVGSRIEVATGGNGRFRIVALPVGNYLLFVRHLGFTPLSTPVQVTFGDTLRLALALARATTVLDPITVAAKSTPSRLGEFEARRQLGEGQFMTQAEIEKLNLVGTGDLLARFTSVNAYGRVVVNRRGVPGRPNQACTFQFFIDGVAIPVPKIEELPSPKEIAGIEVYANSATVPLQYKTFGGDASFQYGGGFCGVILLWTRSDGSP